MGMHGDEYWVSPATYVLADVDLELDAQDEKWGTGRDFPDAPIPESACDSVGAIAAADRLERTMRAEVERKSANGTISWLDIFLEEMAEAATAATRGDVANLRVELVQVAALACQWAAALDKRQTS